MSELLLKQEVYAIIGAAIEVHRELGHGFSEPVYQEVMEIELKDRGIPYEPQKTLVIPYKGRPLTKFYVADFVCYGQIIVEIKALTRLSGTEEAQLLNYLKATVCELACLSTLVPQESLNGNDSCVDVNLRGLRALRG